MEIDPRVTEAMTHVQRAALEMIAAMRNALDVAEDLVADPQVLRTMLSMLSTFDASVPNGGDECVESPEGTVAAERVQRISVDD
jgi:hypothetical protein